MDLMFIIKYGKPRPSLRIKVSSKGFAGTVTYERKKLAHLIQFFEITLIYQNTAIERLLLINFQLCKYFSK